MRGWETNWIHDWPFEAWFTLLLVAFLPAWALWCYWRDRSEVRRWQWWLLVSLRIASLTLIFLLAWGWQRVRYETEPPRLIVIIDTSRSMQEADGVEGAQRADVWRRYLASLGIHTPRRIDAARTMLTDRVSWLLRAARRNDIVYYTAADQLAGPISTLRDRAPDDRIWHATGQSSRLGNAIRDALRAAGGRPTTAIVMLTDGNVTGGLALQDAATEARARGVPLFFVGLGRRQPAHDVAIESVTADSPVFVGDQVAIDVAIRTTPTVNQPLELAVRDRATDRVLVRQQLTETQPGSVVRTRMWLRAEKVGLQSLVVQVSPLPDEPDVDNNSREIQLDVQDSLVRVLLVAGKPSWEYRFLKQFLERSVSPQGEGRAIELVTVLQDADPEYAAQDESAEVIVPVQPSELFRFDVVILLDADIQSINPASRELLRSFVEDRGGGLIIGAGPQFFPACFRSSGLEALLPFPVDDVQIPAADQLLLRELRVRPTRLGKRHPVLQLESDNTNNDNIWNDLPGLRWTASVTESSVRSDSQVLLVTEPDVDGKSKPVLIWRYVGPGNVVVHMTDETYRWARWHGDDRYYRRYWMQLIRDAGRNRLGENEQAWQLTTDRRTYDAGEPIEVRARLLSSSSKEDAATPRVAWESDRGETGSIELARDPDTPRWYTASIPRLPPGQYVLRIATRDRGRGPSASITVRSHFGESAHLTRDTQSMEQAAEVSKGRMYEIDQVRRLASDLPKGKPTRIAALPPQPVWNRMWLLGILSSFLLLEWAMRRLLSLS